MTIEASTIHENLHTVLVAFIDPDEVDYAVGAVLEFFGNLDPDAPTELIADHLRHDLSDTRRLLTHALIGEDRDRRDQYNRSPAFRSSVDTLVAMLPAWVDGLAANAAQADAELAAAMDLINRGPMVIRMDETMEPTVADVEMETMGVRPPPWWTSDAPDG